MTVQEDDERIRRAFEELNQLIIARVERERRSDQLTGLPNGLALEEAIDRHVQAGSELWAAFVEVDKFKSVNDRFGYERADELLRAVAKMLADLAGLFPGDAQVFRQHGDEFFLVGADTREDAHRADAIASLLEMTRKKVEGIEVPVRPGTSKESVAAMTCTVSVGWLVKADLAGIDVVTARKILVCLERAIDEAKRTRNCAIRFSRTFERRQTVSLRADCAACRTKFSADVPAGANSDPFHCPNCGATMPRPHTPTETPIDEAGTLDV